MSSQDKEVAFMNENTKQMFTESENDDKLNIIRK